MASPRPRRKIRTTILVVVEGDTELAFCLYLKRKLSYYIDASVRVECAHGGGPKGVIMEAIGILRYNDFDYRFALFDADIPLTEDIKRKIHEHRIESLQPSPCFEGWLLNLLDGGAPRKSIQCKKKFEAKHLDSKAKLDADSYNRLIPRKEFSELKKRDALFARLLQIFSNQLITTEKKKEG